MLRKKNRDTYHSATEVISKVISCDLLNSPNETNIGIDNESSVFMFRLRKFALPPEIVSVIFWQLAKMLSTISSFVCTHLAMVTWLQIKILFYDGFNNRNQYMGRLLLYFPFKFISIFFL